MPLRYVPALDASPGSACRRCLAATTFTATVASSSEPATESATAAAAAATVASARLFRLVRLQQRRFMRRWRARLDQLGLRSRHRLQRLWRA